MFRKKRIAIAGASGFVGKALKEFLIQNLDFDLVCLSRTDKTNLDNERIEWRQCDLFSMKDIEAGLKGCDYAIYLVHSMIPSAHLVQGNFQDFDLVISDNFARAAKRNNIKRIFYLGGIIPDREVLSPHLASRLEVEQTLEASEIPLTSLRAGLIIGPGGSSFRIMRNLVERLPILICPRWTRSKTCPVYLEDVCRAFYYCITHIETENKIIDLAGGDILTYKSMMQILSEKLGKKRIFISAPFFSPKLSRFWVTLITGAPKDLVYPLVASLSAPMLPKKDRQLPLETKNYSEMLELTLKKESLDETPSAFSYTGEHDDNRVRSIQRIPTPNGTKAKQIVDYYFKWLPKFMFPWIKVEVSETDIFFRFWGIKKPLLILHYSAERSSDRRQLFYVMDSLLGSSVGRGRLEFRDTIDDKSTIAAIHEFKPKLPWYIYKFTQALAHLWVMKAFTKAVNRKFNHVD